jgi:hypothetical protein
LHAVCAAVIVAAGIFASAAETAANPVVPAGTETPCWPTQAIAAVRAGVVAGDPPGVVLAELVDEAVVDGLDDDPHAPSSRQDPTTVVSLRQ